MVINTDRITTALGAIAGLGTIAAQAGIYPKESTAISAIAIALLGLFTNKSIRKS